MNELGKIENLYLKLKDKKITLQQFAIDIVKITHPGQTINDLQLPDDWWEGPGA